MRKNGLKYTKSPKISLKICKIRTINSARNSVLRCSKTFLTVQMKITETDSFFSKAEGSCLAILLKKILRHVWFLLNCYKNRSSYPLERPQRLHLQIKYNFAWSINHLNKKTHRAILKTSKYNDRWPRISYRHSAMTTLMSTIKL